MTRADALRNRNQAIESAREVLAERGLDAPLDEIARRAGIGNATLYRHFPARCDLLGAVCADTLREIAAAGERALSDEDPWAAFTGHLAWVCELCARDRALADLLTTDKPPSDELATLRARAVGAMQALMDRARDEGVLRADCDKRDVVLILKATAGLMQRSDDQPDVWRRHLRLVLDGMRLRARA